MLISNKNKFSNASLHDYFSVNFVAYAEHLKLWFKNSLRYNTEKEIVFLLKGSVVSDLKPMANSGMIFIHPKIQNEKVLCVESRQKHLF